MPEFDIRLRRSALFMPGHNERALSKVRSLDCDVVIIDFEDGVPPNTKPKARNCVATALKEGGYGHRELVVRVNPINSQWGREDIEAIASLDIDAVMLPKLESVDEVIAVVACLDANDGQEKLIWVMAETPRGVLNINTIAAATPRIDCIVVGTEDLGKAMRVPPSPGRLGLLSALTTCVLAARANGLDILDSVYTQSNDTDGLRRNCEQGRALGFDGKTLIHPSQIETANAVFSPTEESVTWSQKVIDAWDRMSSDDIGVITVDGAMIEHLHVAQARRILASQAAITNR
jgi:citrate lyase subunit beta/citryl-CoA lyase